MSKQSPNSTHAQDDSQPGLPAPRNQALRPHLCKHWMWLAVILALLPFGTVLAHPKIVSTEPPADAQLSESPTHIRVIFNEDVEQSFAQVQVFNTRQQQVDLGDGGRAPDNATTLSVSLPSLAPGIYTVVWQAIGSDGHLVKGYYAFSIVGSAPAAPEASTPAAQPEPTPGAQIGAVPPTGTPSSPPVALPALLRSLMLIGAMIAAGAWFFGIWVIRPLRSTLPAHEPTVTRRNQRLIVASLVLLLLAAPAFLAVYAGSVAGSIDLVSVWRTLSSTRLGQAQGARVILALGLLALVGLRLRTSWRTALVAGLYSVLLLTFAGSGHAAAQASELSSILIDWVHLAATALWVGGLAAFALALPLIRRAENSASQPILPQLIARFSPMALVCVALLSASGTYAAARYLTTLSDLWTSAYGQVLLAKITCFGVLIGFGAYHIRLGAKRRQPDHGEQQRAAASEHARHFGLSLRAETMIAIAVIGLAGLLTSLALPDAQASATQPATPLATVPVIGATPRPTRTPAPIKVFDEEQVSADLRVRLKVEPAAIGKNTLFVTVMDASGKQFDVQRVQATLAMHVMDMGETQAIAEPTGNGVYVVGEQFLSMVGEWQISVLVRRSDADDVTVVFHVPIGG